MNEELIPLVLAALAEVADHELDSEVQDCWRDYGHPMQAPGLQKVCFLELLRRGRRFLPNGRLAP